MKSKSHILRLHTGLLRASHVVLVVKNSPANTGDTRDVGSIPGLGRSPGGGHGNSLQYPCLQNPMDRGSWWAAIHTVTKSQTWLKQFSTPALAIPLPGIYQNKLKSSHSNRYICTLIFIAALFTIAKRCKQPKFLSTNKWINRIWYIQTMEHYLP